MALSLIQQDQRELELRRWQLSGQRRRIDALKTWIQGRPEDGGSLAVGKILGNLAIGYVEDCEAAGVTP